MGQEFWTLGHAAAVLLLLGNVTVFPGLMMFWIRRGYRGGPPPSRAYFIAERVFVMGGIMCTVIGFLLLQAQVRDNPVHTLALVSAAAYLFGGILGVVAEALGLMDRYQYQYPITVVYVVLAFLAQAVLGAALAQAGLVAVWIGWATVLWNMAWLVVLPLLTPRDIYFPVLHHVMPLLIGIALLSQAPR